MRFFAPSRALALSVALSIASALAMVTSACEPSASTPATHDAGTPTTRDAGCEWVPCRSRGLLCRGGQVVQLEPASVSTCDDPMLACPEGEVVRTCERGCTEGATSVDADRLCHETRPKAPGDTCATRADCEPGDGDPLACDLARGVCVSVGPERCNGLDDDADGTTDEGCECEPQLIAALPFVGTAAGIAFGPDRIALMSSVAGEGTVRVIDAAGELLAVRERLAYARRVAWVDGGLVVVLQQGTTGTSTLVQLHDDGTESRIALERTAPGERPWVLRDGDGWILVTPVRSTSLGMTRHAADGSRTAWAQASGISDVVFVASQGASQGGPSYLGLVGSPGLAILDGALELVPASMPGGVVAPYDATSAGDSLVFLTITREGRPGIVVRDARGEVSDARELRDAEYLGRGARVAAEHEGGRIGVAWMGHDEVRVHVARADDLERVGELGIPAPYGATFGLGDAGSGLRLVVDRAGQWEIHDPCPRE